MDPTEFNAEAGGLDRRSVLKRGAILGGALVWTAPAVQTLAGPAFAAGSPPCCAKLGGGVNGQCQTLLFREDADCCSCISEQGTILPAAILACTLLTRCVPTGTTTDCNVAC